MAKEDVFLDAEIPYVRLCERPWRTLKTISSKRELPLVGAALWALKRAYESSPNDHLFLVIVLMMDARRTMPAIH